MAKYKSQPAPCSLTNEKWRCPIEVGEELIVFPAPAVKETNKLGFTLGGESHFQPHLILQCWTHPSPNTWRYFWHQTYSSQQNTHVHTQSGS